MSNGAWLAFVTVALAAAATQDPPAKKEKAITDQFFEEKGNLGPTGKNPYFILEPGYVLVRKIDGVDCRIVEERETVDGGMKLVKYGFPGRK